MFTWFPPCKVIIVLFELVPAKGIEVANDGSGNPGSTVKDVVLVP